MRMRQTKIYVFDVDSEVLTRCEEMARLNGVEKSVVAGGFCDSKTLQALPLQRRALILSDCEGYEKELLSEEIVPLLAQHDLLIEIHDFVDLEISDTIRRRFEKSHYIEVIPSIDDIKKAQSYSYPEIEKFKPGLKRILLAEHRPTAMEWFYLKAKSQHPQTQQM